MPLIGLLKKLTRAFSSNQAAEKTKPAGDKKPVGKKPSHSNKPVAENSGRGKPRPAQPAQKSARPERPARAASGDASDKPQREQRPPRERPTRERSERGRGPRRENREAAKDAAPLQSQAVPEHTNVSTAPATSSRPGGGIHADERSRRKTAHDAWDPASYQVAPEEGKRRFCEFNLPPEIVHAIADLGFQYCTPIQALSLENALAGRDIAGKAQTGTGKTAAFLIAILTRYLRSPEARPTEPGRPRALVLAPTRELVIQICKDADAIGKYCGLRYLAIYGGMDYDLQRREIQAEPVDLIVATPGRLIDYTMPRGRTPVVDLSHVDTLVIDEADRMLDMGFIPAVRRIISKLPPAGKRCTMLYSATLSDVVMRLAGHWMNDPFRVEIESETVTIDTVKQVVYAIATREKITVLYNLIRLNPNARILVFCNRRSSTEYVTEKLRRLGVRCDTLSGDVQQNRRLQILEAFRAGKLHIVIATDVAGRGIHVDNIEYVVNYDFPYEAEDYVHRIGRTGRAGQTGTAISFADEDESFVIPQIEKYINMELKCTQPDEALFTPIPERRGSSRAPRPETPAENNAPVSVEDTPPSSSHPADVPTLEEAAAMTAPAESGSASLDAAIEAPPTDESNVAPPPALLPQPPSDEPPAPREPTPGRLRHEEEKRLAEQRRLDRKNDILRRVAEEREAAAKRKAERMAAAERMNAERHEAALKRKAEIASKREAAAERASKPEHYEAPKARKPPPPPRERPERERNTDDTPDASSSVRYSNYRAARVIPPPILLKGPAKSEEWTPGG